METRKVATGTVLLVIAALFVLFYTVRLVLLVMAIGVGVGTLLIPVVRWARTRAKIPASVTAFLVLLVLLALIGGVGYCLYVIGAEQMGKVIKAIPSVYADFRQWLAQHAHVELGANNAGVNIASAVQNILNTVIAGATIGFEVAAGAFFLVSVALYVAVDPARNQEGFLTLFPAHARPRVKELMHQSARTLRQWFLSHLIVVSCVGAMFALGLWIIGNPYWILFGFLAAVLDFVPYIGPYTIAFGASIVELTTGHPMGVLWVIVLDLVIQELEGHVLLPIVMKERISLPPVQLITLAILMALWFGILGIFAAPPFLAVLRIVYLSTYAKRMDQSKKPSLAAAS